jgi:hypothetical protein
LANSGIQAKLRETVTYRDRKHYLQQYQVFIKFASDFCIKRHVIKHKSSTAANAWAKDITKGYIKLQVFGGHHVKSSETTKVEFCSGTCQKWKTPDEEYQSARFPPHNPLATDTCDVTTAVTCQCPGQGAGASWQSHAECGQLFHQSHIHRQKW